MRKKIVVADLNADLLSNSVTNSGPIVTTVNSAGRKAAFFWDSNSATFRCLTALPNILLVSWIETERTFYALV